MGFCLKSAEDVFEDFLDSYSEGEKDKTRTINERIAAFRDRLSSAQKQEFNSILNAISDEHAAFAFLAFLEGYNSGRKCKDCID